MEIVRRFSQGTRSEIRCLETCAHPELIDAGPVVAPLRAPRTGGTHAEPEDCAPSANAPGLRTDLTKDTNSL